MRACMHACIHTYIHTYIHTSIHPYIHTYILTYIHTSILTYVLYLLYLLYLLTYGSDTEADKHTNCHTRLLLLPVTTHLKFVPHSIFIVKIGADHPSIKRDSFFKGLPVTSAF